MEYKIKTFFDYLLYIGITNEETSPNIIQLLRNKYNDFKNQPIDIDNLLISLICEYFKQLTSEQIMQIGKNIYDQFSKNRLITQKKYLKKIIPIKYRFYRRKLKRYFNKWRLITIYLPSHSSYNNKNKQFHSLSENNSETLEKKSSASSSQISKYPFLNRLDIYESHKELVLKKLKEKNESTLINSCTFSPNRRKKKLKKYTLMQRQDSSDTKKNKGKQKLFQILYEQYNKTRRDKEELKRKIDEECGYTFAPNLNFNSDHYKSIKENFFQRNQKMIDKKKENYCLYLNHFNSLYKKK